MDLLFNIFLPIPWGFQENLRLEGHRYGFLVTGVVVVAGVLVILFVSSLLLSTVLVSIPLIVM